MKRQSLRPSALNLIDEVAATGKEIVITKHGRPVSRLLAYHPKPETLFGIDRGRFEIVGDIDEPIDVEWEAEAGDLPERI